MGDVACYIVDITGKLPVMLCKVDITDSPTVSQVQPISSFCSLKKSYIYSDSSSRQLKFQFYSTTPTSFIPDPQ